MDFSELLLDGWQDSVLARTSARSTDTRIYLPLIAKTAEANLASLFATAIHPFQAVVTATRELKKMSFDFEVGLTGQPLLQVAEVAIGEVSHCAAVGANQVMVVF